MKWYSENLRLRPLHPDLFQETGLSFLPKPIKGRSRLPERRSHADRRHRPGDLCEHSSNWPSRQASFLPFQYILTLFLVFSPGRRAAEFKKDSNGHGISPCSSNLGSISASTGDVCSEARKRDICNPAAPLPKAHMCSANTGVRFSNRLGLGTARQGKDFDDSTSACDGFLFIHADADIPCLLYDLRALLNRVVRNAL